MKRAEILCYEGKRIQIILRNNFQYHGQIKSCSERTLIFQDKYDTLISINIDDIMMISEVPNAS